MVMQTAFSRLQLDGQDFTATTWTDILAAGVHSAAELQLQLGVDRRCIEPVIKRYPVRINPYYLSLVQKPYDPIWIQAVPDPRELDDGLGSPDPCREQQQSPVPGLIHRYPDRAVLMAGNQCSVFCRHCMRKRAVGIRTAVAMEGFFEAVDYIGRHPRIREVIVSGGDPLLLTDSILADLLKRLRAIRHVEVLRIHSRVLCTLPQRITPALSAMLARFHPLYINTQFNHPREITPAATIACSRLSAAGIPLGCQTVLLKGVNDDPETMKQLVLQLLKIRVRPYYIHHPDPVAGTGHLRVPLKTGLRILRSLRGFVSGMAVPHYMIDLPGGGGKVPLLPEYIQQVDKDRLVVQSYEGKRYEYPLR